MSSPSPAEPYQRPEALEGRTYKARSACGTTYCTVNKDEEGHVVEVIARLGRSGSCARTHIELEARLISVALQHGVPLEELAAQCTGAHCGAETHLLPPCITRLGDALHEAGGIERRPIPTSGHLKEE